MKPLEPLNSAASEPLPTALTAKSTFSKRLRAKTADNADTTYLKIIAFGNSGTGKTKAIGDFLRLGMKVFVIATDVGGSGLSTVKLDLASTGEGHLLANLAEFEFTDYEQVVSFIDNPGNLDVILHDGTVTPLLSWDPDLIAWEGFSNFQNTWLRDYVLSMQPGTKGSSELRNEGLRAEIQDWDAIKAGTNSRLDKFLRMHNPVTGKKIHKYVTCHENEPRENTLTGDVQRDPMISGGARKNFGAGFDVVLQTIKSKTRTKDGKPTYQYNIDSDAVLTKSRGFVFPSTKIDANMRELWVSLVAQLAAVDSRKKVETSPAPRTSL